MVDSAFLVDGVMVIRPYKKLFWKCFHSQNVTEDTMFQIMTTIRKELMTVCLNYFKTIHYVQWYVQLKSIM